MVRKRPPVRVRHVVYHTYSRHAPDGDPLAPCYYQLLDQVPKGRGEAFRAIRHDEYEDAGSRPTG